MARHENEDISDLNIPAAYETTVEFFGEKGQKVESDISLCKTVSTYLDYETYSIQYFVRVGRGEVIDPYGADFGYTKSKLSSMYKFKKVSKDAFESYQKYLKTKNRLHFTNARRLVME